MTKAVNNAAQEIIDIYRSGSQFIFFLAEAIDWVVQYKKPVNGLDAIPLLTGLIQAVGTKWIDSPEREQEAISEGIEELKSTYQVTEYFDLLGKITTAQVHDLHNNGQWSKEYRERFTEWTRGLFVIGNAIS